MLAGAQICHGQWQSLVAPRGFCKCWHRAHHPAIPPKSGSRCNARALWVLTAAICKLLRSTQIAMRRPASWVTVFSLGNVFPGSLPIPRGPRSGNVLWYVFSSQFRPKTWAADGAALEKIAQKVCAQLQSLCLPTRRTAGAATHAALSANSLKRVTIS